MKNFLKKFLTNKVSGKIAGLVFGLSLFILALPAKAHAAFLIDTILGKAIGWVVFVINYIIATIFGVGIAIISYFISIVLQLNTAITGSLIVSSGFTITLAVANLGFVLAIIVIAIATILRYETYALKQTLWKLVAAAILVNFSLVIAGAILNFSDQLTTYFLDSFSQSCSSSVVTFNPYDCFATSIAGAFAPQRMFLAPNNATDTDSINKWQGAGQDFGGIITVILNIFFPTIFLIITVIALAGLFIMLLIRYIYIAILLIIMPMAWLLWIFPATSGHWKAWWSKFIQWTMFAPVVIFFIYLAIMTSGLMASQQQNDPTQTYIQGRLFTSDNSNSMVAAISNLVGNTLSGMLGSLLQMSVTVALLFAGLFMGQKMGITFASTTLSGATAVTKGFGTWAGRIGARTGTFALRTQTGRQTATRLQQNTLGAGLRKVGTGGGIAGKIFGAPVRGLGRGIEYGTAMAGRGMENLAVAGGENMAKAYDDDVKNLTKDQTLNQLSSSSAPRRHALLKKIRGEKWDTEPEDIERVRQYLQEDRKDEFERYGNGKLFNDERKDTGIELMEKVRDGKLDLGDRNALEEYFRNFSNPGNLAQIFFQNRQGKPVPFGLDDATYGKIQQTIAKGVAVGFRPDNTSAFVKNLAKGNQISQFEAAAHGAGLTENDVSEENKRWLASTGARNIGINIETFIKGGVAQKISPEDEKEDEEAKNKTGKYSTF